MVVLLWILLATLAISLIAFIGILTLILKEKVLEKILLMLVALSAGGLMGGAFLHLMPEAMEKSNPYLFLYVLVGFILFFFIEKILHWKHCHQKGCKIHSFAYMNLLGDTVHNFIDGLIIAAGFVVDIYLGIITTLTVALHEVPQEIGDFGVLLYGGFKKVKALTINFVTALAAVLGGLFGYFLFNHIASLVTFLLPFAVGGFVYIAASDLIPEIRKETSLKKSLGSIGIFILGILLMFGLKFINH